MLGIWLGIVDTLRTPALCYSLTDFTNSAQEFLGI